MRFYFESRIAADSKVRFKQIINTLVFDIELFLERI